MKNSKKGFIIPAIIALVLILTISGTYVYLNNKKTNNIKIDNVENSIKNNYIITTKDGAEVVTWHNSSLPIYGADPKTFITLNINYGKDSKTVYYQGLEVKGAEPKTFEPISDKYGKDQNSVFVTYNKIEGADLKTFEIIDENFYDSKDKNNNYSLASKISYVAKPNTNVIINPVTDSVGPQKCSDSKCFINLIQNCSTGSFQTKTENDFLGSNIKAEINFNIFKSDNKCLLGSKLLSYSITPTQELVASMKGAETVGPSPDEVYSKLNKDMQDNYVGKNGVCDITNDIKDVSDAFKKGNQAGLVVDPDYKICSGDLFIKSKIQ